VEQETMEDSDRRKELQERITRILQDLPDETVEHLLDAWLWEMDTLLKDDPELLRQIARILEENGSDTDPSLL
jgi:uncharacterized protein HemY